MARRKYTKQSARIPREKPTPNPIPLDPPPENTSPILRTGPDSVVYHIPTSPSPTPKTTILLPTHSTWTSGLHFHTSHTEYLRLIRGCIHVYIGNNRLTLSASASGEIDWSGTFRSPGLIVKIDKGVRHNWGRADVLTERQFICAEKRQLPGDWKEDVVVEEWTDPADISKPLFFWNLNGVITGTSEEEGSLSTRTRAARWVLGNWWVPFQLFGIFWELDNWPVFLSLRGAFTGGLIGERVGGTLEHGMEYVMTFMVLFFVSMLGRLVGVKAVAEERTPKALWEAYRIGMARSEKVE